ncbi:hypothetical protein BN159_7794 [Streptomyces davaonensis JCM 4913]|uniref:Phytanoyl-CoA dioxygenase n=1 Tax=Streptomyces davaonensis (strain DSM 101723 / JCM 4913 / KCC S-0913 / 768) TaxID=1214101 RepID=K4REF7_STRDJ|nr:hypothetical protein [Streptomyces davaonensis]CCK32173.1 hypothetical protein BN159_7794 [Streptomyces davaonensis JCM 4913]
MATVITSETRTAFRQQGFVVIPGVLSGEQIAAGREIVTALLEQRPFADDHVGPYFLWPRFAAEGHPLLDFYRETGIGELAAQLLRSDLDVEDPIFASRAPARRPGTSC